MAQQSKSKKKTSRPDAKFSSGLPPLPLPPPTSRWLVIVQALVLIALGVFIYYPSLHGLYLWDDDFLIQNNVTVHDPNGLWYIWSNPEQALIDFFPLTVSVEWLIWQIFVPGPSAPPDPGFAHMTVYYHTTGLILHLCSAMLVWVLFRRLGIRWAWLGALIFTVHPVIVESVSWMAELKNTIAMPPFLLAMMAWMSFDRTRRFEYYIISFLLYVIALLCKTSVVMFPVVILLYTWWKHGRLNAWDNLHTFPDFEKRVFRAIGEFIPNFIPTIPFFIVAAADAYFLIEYLRHGVGEQFIPLGGALSRIACAGLSLLFYFSKCILPMNLIPIYPQWPIDPPTPMQFLPWPVMALGFWWLLRRRKQPWARIAIFGFGYFFIMIVPFTGFRAISFMRFQWVMDHFLYVPILGLIGLAAAAAGQVYDRLSRSIPDWRITSPAMVTTSPRFSPVWRVALIATIVAIVAVFTIGSHLYAEIFVNRLVYWTYCSERNFMGWPAHNNRGNQLLDNAGQAETRGRQLLEQAKLARANGNQTEAADLSVQAGQLFTEAQSLYGQSEDEFKIALQLNPVYTEAHNNLGYILSKQGHYKEAEAEFLLALSYTPDFESAQMNLRQVQQLEAAQANNGAAPPSDQQPPPPAAQAHNAQGIELAKQGKIKEAEAEFRQALQLAPDFQQAEQNLAHVMQLEAASTNKKQ